MTLQDQYKCKKMFQAEFEPMIATSNRDFLFLSFNLYL